MTHITTLAKIRSTVVYAKRPRDCAKRSLRPWDSQNWVFRVFVRSFVRPFVRPFGIFGIFTKRIWGDHRCRWTLRFWNTGFKSFCKKRVEVLLSKQNEKYVDRFLDHFFGTFLKKVEIHIFHPSRFALVPCAVYLVRIRRAKQRAWLGAVLK